MTVLILGGTSPIARAIANKYAEYNHSIFIAARNPDEASDIAADIGIRFNVPTSSAAFDATEFDTHVDFVAAVEADLGSIDVVLVAFGDMGDQDSSEQDFAKAKHVIDVNYTGAASISEAVAESMIGRGRGSIIGITSVAGDRGRKSNYFYGSAKGAFGLYLQGLRNRCFDSGVHVMNVKLGFVDTPMTYGMETGIPIASPEQVAQAVYKAQSRGENELYYPRFWRGIMGVIKAIPEGLFKRLSL